MNYFTTDKLIMPERGDLLISEPYLPDPNFERTVVLLCEHDDNGSFGFVLNRPAKAQLGELIDELDGFHSEVYLGGPVQKNTLHFLHRGSHFLTDDKKIVDGVYWGVDFEKLLDGMNTNQLVEDDLKFFVGYSGWSPGQLVEELNHRSWIVYKRATEDIVFNLDPMDLWKEVLKGMGGKFKVMSNYPLDPRLN